MTVAHQVPQVTVIGDIARDVNVRVAGRVPGDLVAAGDTPARIRTSLGGSAGVTAAWLAYQGVPVRLISARGDDHSGTALEADLLRLGVEPRLQIVMDHPTGTVVVLVDSTGERTMLPDPGANAHLTSDWCVREIAGRHLHVSAYPWFRPETRATVEAAIAEARTRSMTVSVDLNSHSLVTDHGRELEVLLDQVDIIFANSDESLALGNSWRPRDSCIFVVKLGDAGARWATDGDTGHSPAIDAPLVDTVGAGDAFAAGFLTSWLADGLVGKATAAGNSVAAVCVARVGPAPGCRP